MFRLFTFVLRWVIRAKVLILAVASGMAIAYGLQLREQYRTWGRSAAHEQGALRGDDLVTTPDVVETRTLTIEAPPVAVWPWLAQLGYGRGGWYGFAQLERPWRPGAGPMAQSSDVILEAYQDLAEGDLVPTHPEGGFIARVVDPEAALVLYLDDAMARDQFASAAADGNPDAEAELSEMDMPSFAVSWAFLLEPVGSDRTRLTERLRLRIEDISGAQRRGVPVVRMALFALMRSQMLGIAQRAEQASLARRVGAETDEPATA
jgi:hypothetical protein